MHTSRYYIFETLNSLFLEKIFVQYLQLYRKPEIYYDKLFFNVANVQRGGQDGRSYNVPERKRRTWCILNM